MLFRSGVSNTSEKSARYTKMQPQTEKEREFYEKWHTLVLERICEVYPGKFDEKEAKAEAALIEYLQAKAEYRVFRLSENPKQMQMLSMCLTICQ